MVSEQKIKQPNEAFDKKLTEAEQRKLLNLFKPDSNRGKAIRIMLHDGSIHNWEFNYFSPPCLSYRDVIYFIRMAIDEQIPTLKLKRYNEKGKDNFWRIERRQDA